MKKGDLPPGVVKGIELAFKGVNLDRSALTELVN